MNPNYDSYKLVKRNWGQKNIIKSFHESRLKSLQVIQRISMKQIQCKQLRSKYTNVLDYDIDSGVENIWQ